METQLKAFELQNIGCPKDPEPGSLKWKNSLPVAASKVLPGMQTLMQELLKLKIDISTATRDWAEVLVDYIPLKLL